MIKTSELRQGNLIQFSENGSTCIVKGIDADNKGLTVYSPSTGEEIWIEVDQFEPITLSGKWFEILGFERFNRGKWKLKDGFHWIEADNYSVHMFQQQIALIECVHHLQNFYFPITHQELKYTL
jgi:hypothetical protein